MKTFYFLLFLSVCSLWAEEIQTEWGKSFQKMNVEDRLYLESFFRTMLSNSEGGFVLTGSKPACMEGILFSEKISAQQIGSKMHRRSVDLQEGYRVWKKYFESIPSKKLIIICKNHPDQLYSDWIHLVWINPKKLTETVQENLPLFQYVLGPQVTPDSFLNFLADPFQDIPHDYTLTGIFLGFGSQNALYYRRLELIQNQMFSREDIPFNSKEKLLKISNVYLGFDKTKPFSTNPSFNYSDLTEEYQNLETMGSSSYSASFPSPLKIPLFSIYKKDQETLEILSSYQNDQKLIENLLLEPNFLESTLRYIFE